MIAGLVIAVGAALAVSAFIGGRRWLVLPALILAIPLGFVAAAGIDVDGGVGDRDYQPTSVNELRDGYELGMGELRLDLTQVDLPPGRTPLKLDIGIGSLRVIVPDDVCVASDVRVGAGYARVLDRDSGGLDVDWRSSPVDNAGVKRLVIHGDVGIGELQIVNSRTEFTDWEHSDRVEHRFDDDFRFGRNKIRPDPRAPTPTWPARRRRDPSRLRPRLAGRRARRVRARRPAPARPDGRDRPPLRLPVARAARHDRHDPARGRTRRETSLSEAGNMAGMSALEQPAAQPPPLRRDRDGAIVGGVCAGLGRRLGIDPIILRIVFIAAPRPAASASSPTCWRGRCCPPWARRAPRRCGCRAAATRGAWPPASGC